MRYVSPTLRTQTRPSELDSAIGQIDWIGESGEVLRSWRIRSPKCTLGSAGECSIQLTAEGIQSHHLTLVFGKKLTLLRAVGPTRIAGRLVREWLIDHPTEVHIGPCHLVVHPTIGAMATVVHAEGLIEQAAKLCKDPTPIVTGDRTSVPGALRALPTSAAPESNSTLDINLHNIEGLLTELQTSLDKLQSSLAPDANPSHETIAKKISEELGSFGNTWFSSLSHQFAQQQEFQSTLASNLSEQVASGFQSLDEHLSRVNESNSVHANHLDAILEISKSHQSAIENRFQELVSHRDELMQAVQFLRTEIENTYRNSIDGLVTENQQLRGAPLQADLVESLERAQLQIQNYNQQLEALESEKAFANQDLASASTATPQYAEPQYAEPQYAEPQYAESQYAEPQYAEPQYAEPQYAEPQYAEPQYAEPQYAEPQYAEPQYAEPQYAEPQYAEPQYAEPQYAEPQYADPQYADPQYAEPQYTEPQYADPQYAEPQYAEPQYAESQYAESQYAESQYAEPQYGEPQYAEPQYAEPQYAEPQYGESQYAEPQDVHDDEVAEYVSPLMKQSSSDEGLYLPDAPLESAGREQSQEKPALPAWFLRDELPEQSSRPSHQSSDFEEENGSPRPGSVSYLGDASPGEALPSTAAETDSNEESEFASNAINERLHRMLQDADVRRMTKSTGELPPSRSWSQAFEKQREIPEDSDSLEDSESVSMLAPPKSERLSVSFSSADRVEQVPKTVHQLTGEHTVDSSEIDNQIGHPSIYEAIDVEIPEEEIEEVLEQVQVVSSKASPVEQASEEEESIEEYMQRLLQRVRGSTDNAGGSPRPEDSIAKGTPTSKNVVGKSKVAASLGIQLENIPEVATEVTPLTDTSFVPRQQAPEQRNEIDALRELANSNARRAISRSDHRRTNSALLFKLCITGIAVTCGVALLLLNGLTLNAPFAGFIASVVVAILWGYDCVNHFKKIQTSNTQQIQDVATARTASSIQVGSTDGNEDRWRPSAT